jgi:hypothetical protein
MQREQCEIHADAGLVLSRCAAADIVRRRGHAGRSRGRPSR